MNNAKTKRKLSRPALLGIGMLMMFFWDQVFGGLLLDQEAMTTAEFLLSSFICAWVADSEKEQA